MLDAFVVLTAVAGKIGSVTAANMYDSDYMCFDIVTEEGAQYSLTLRKVKPVEKTDAV